MSALFESIKRHARDVLPVREGETYDEYRARMVQTLTPSQRAMIAAEMGRESRRAKKDQAQRRRLWIASSRLAFAPGPRCRCAVCLRYEGVTEAHHVYPLWLQFDAGEAIPIQEFCWLCPTHHRLMHEIIVSLMANRQPRLEGVPFDEQEELDNLGVRFVNHWRRSPHVGIRPHMREIYSLLASEPAQDSRVDPTQHPDVTLLIGTTIHKI
jgi:hypothetical protein